MLLLLFIYSGNLNAQTNINHATENKTYAVFGLFESALLDWGQLEIQLKEVDSYEMVRIDPVRKTIFIVSKNGFQINEENLKLALGANFNSVKCLQLGVLGVNEINFEQLYECNEN